MCRIPRIRATWHLFSRAPTPRGWRVQCGSSPSERALQFPIGVSTLSDSSNSPPDTQRGQWSLRRCRQPVASRRQGEWLPGHEDLLLTLMFLADSGTESGSSAVRCRLSRLQLRQRSKGVVLYSTDFLRLINGQHQYDSESVGLTQIGRAHV